jgi:hypothetical protein
MFLYFQRITFFNLVKNVAQEVLKVDIGKLLEHLTPKNEKLVDNHIRSLIFGDYVNSEKIYDEIVDLDELSKTMDK